MDIEKKIEKKKEKKLYLPLHFLNIQRILHPERAQPKISLQYHSKKINISFKVDDSI
jgi:hypothetical protein